MNVIRVLIIGFLLYLLVIMILEKQQVRALPQVQHHIPQNIQVRMYALDARGNISELCNRNDPITSITYGCGTPTDPYDYDDSLITVNLQEEYLPAVLAREIGTADDEAIEAQAIASRSYALHQIDVQGGELWNSSNHQVFAPKSEIPTADQRDAVQDTAGMLLVCGERSNCFDGRVGMPIWAEFSNGHAGGGEFTIASPQAQHPYLISVWDPIHTSTNGHGRGMDHEAAKLWATGELDDNGRDYHPAWDFRRILAHYYTKVDFQGVPNTTNSYRFNVIRLFDAPNR